MKRFLALMLALTMLLCGCGQDKKPEGSTSTATTPSTSVPVVEPGEPPVKDFGCYLPDSDIEVATDGAVKAYELEGEDHRAIQPLGDGLLLLSGDENTVLTYIGPDGATVTATLEEQFLFLEDLTVVSERNAIAYYDMMDRAVVLLDTSLQELERVTLPETIVGEPAVSSDWSMIYYFTEDELRCLKTSTGIDRMLKQISFPLQEIQKLHFDGSVLECLVVDEDMSQVMMISAKTGELLYATEDMPTLSTCGDRFFALHYESGITQYLFGTRGEDVQCLDVDSPLYLDLPEMWAAVTCEETDPGVTMGYYDLETGTRSSAVELPMTGTPQCMAADPQRDAIWFIALDEAFESKLYRWDVAMSQTDDTASYVTPYYTALEPDLEGLEQIAERADALGREHGIRIRVYEDALRVQPSDYTLECQHLVPVYDKYLTELEEALAEYPAGFLKKLGSTSDNGKLTISLVKGAYGSNDIGSLNSADGVHFYDDGDVYIALVMGAYFRGTLYHELFHAIDTYVMSQCNVYDDWGDLNPSGFEYDNDYVANQFREDYQYLEDDRWFIDMYSMSYAKEDRARIMEYAMQSGNEEFFASEHMQAKLEVLCKGIRTAFGLKNVSEILPWEQYLT